MELIEGEWRTTSTIRRRLGRLDHLLKDAFHVQNAQLERAADQLIVRIVREPGYDDEVSEPLSGRPAETGPRDGGPL